MANENKATKSKSEVGIIGQMYEERKSKKLGVLESREEKFKTLLMRDPEGKSFNITYSTFKSNWRKYSGEAVVQTSTQVEEEKQEKAEALEEAKEVVEKVTEKPTMSREDKVKAVRALRKILEEAFVAEIPEMRVNTCANGAIKFYHKHKRYMGAYVRTDGRYTFDTIKDVADKITVDDTVEVIVNEDWKVGYRYRFAQDRLDEVSRMFIEAIKSLIAEKEKNEKPENEESEE